MKQRRPQHARPLTSGSAHEELLSTRAASCRRPRANMLHAHPPYKPAMSRGFLAGCFSSGALDARRCLCCIALFLRTECISTKCQDSQYQHIYKNRLYCLALYSTAGSWKQYEANPRDGRRYRDSSRATMRKAYTKKIKSEHAKAGASRKSMLIDTVPSFHHNPTVPSHENTKLLRCVVQTKKKRPVPTNTTSHRRP